MFNIVKSTLEINNEKVVHDFLSSLLIEVATENYRQLMFEQLMLTGNAGAMLLDPPLRANESVMSGLFANALSRVSARSKPEVRIDRLYEDGDVDEELSEKSASVGRVDYLAWYASSTIALELKVAGVNWATPVVTEIAKKRWESVVNQADSARAALCSRSDRRFPDPHSIALLVWVSRSAVEANAASFDEKQNVDRVAHLAMGFTTSNWKGSPDFIATYTFPSGFRNFIRKRKGKESEGDEMRSTPFVTFIAYVAK